MCDGKMSVKSIYVSTDDFIKRYCRSKFTYHIYKDEVENEYYFFTSCSCFVAKIYNDGCLDHKLDCFYHDVVDAIKCGRLVHLKFCR